ncbi:unnamed protein product [Symbiodinium sp. CCMP2456]|nr:unnamed protein product [Symbiodinium sp. CCMP2456]
MSPLAARTAQNSHLATSPATGSRHMELLTAHRRVDPRFRYMAMLLVTCLLSGLVAYVVLRVGEITSAAQHPPVETSLEPWDGVGRWAVCPGDFTELKEAGYKISGETVMETSIEYIPHVSGKSLHCLIVDLRSWRWSSKQPWFTLCGVGYIQIYVWSEEHWQYVAHENYGNYAGFRVQKRKLGRHNGVDTNVHDVFSFSNWGEDTPISDARERCSVWTPVLDQPTPSSGCGALQFFIQDSYVEVHIEQGVMPQVWTLFGSVGGYLTILSLIFNLCFVRKYPDGPIAKEYDALTWTGEAWCSSLFATVSQRRDPAPETLGFSQRRDPAPETLGFPVFPPGIRQPAGANAQASE